jgi:DUF2934 family protein
MEITVFDSKGRFTTMAKKAAKTAAAAAGATASASPAPAPIKKTEGPRVKKHVKAKVVEATEAAPAVAKTITHEEISRLAYKFYLDRGGVNGSPAEDWARAEQALLASL